MIDALANALPNVTTVTRLSDTGHYGALIAYLDDAV